MSDPITRTPGGAGPEERPEPAEPAPPATGAADTGPDGGAGPDRPAGSRKRRRGRRGGRNRQRAADAPAGAGPTAERGTVQPPAEEYARRPDDLPDRPGEGEPGGPAAEGPAVAPRPEPEPAAAEGPRPRIGDSRPAPPPFVPKIPPPRPQPARPDTETGAATAKKRRRRGGRRRGGSARRAAAQLAAAELGEAAVRDDETMERRGGRERKGRPVGRYLMCVHARPHATQIAVLEGRVLIEHYVSRPQDDATQIDGNIYLGRVQNVLPGMEAAFIDIGTPKNAVLYRGDLRYDPDDIEGPSTGRRDARIEQLLRPGQTIKCQVTKNPIGSKGARLTQEVSLPGRFVVLIPNSDTYGISKRLDDEERKRLRRVLDEVKPDTHGLIVRTAAEGATADELRRDVLRLVGQWTQIDALAQRSKVPARLYQEPGMAVRVIREELNRDYRGVVIDDPTLHDEVRDYVASINPELADRVELYDPAEEAGLPMFERYHVHEQLHKALDRKVWLPSGGSLMIDRTEALTVIDVNTGKNVGTSNLEETVYRNNLEAAEEVARQLRLRDIGGIIVIDFIDMEIRQNRDDVMRAFRDALARDKTRSQVFDISDLGLVEMTRKRVSEGLVESFSSTCPTCNGRGILMDDTLL